MKKKFKQLEIIDVHKSFGNAQVLKGENPFLERGLLFTLKGRNELFFNNAKYIQFQNVSKINFLIINTMEKEKLNTKMAYEKPRVKVVKPIFSKAFTTTYDATSHKK